MGIIADRAKHSTTNSGNSASNPSNTETVLVPCGPPGVLCEVEGSPEKVDVVAWLMLGTVITLFAWGGIEALRNRKR